MFTYDERLDAGEEAWPALGAKGALAELHPNDPTADVEVAPADVKGRECAEVERLPLGKLQRLVRFIPFADHLSTLPFVQRSSYVWRTAGNASVICVSVVGEVLAPSLKDAPDW